MPFCLIPARTIEHGPLGNGVILAMVYFIFHAFWGVGLVHLHGGAFGYEGLALIEGKADIIGRIITEFGHLAEIGIPLEDHQIIQLWPTGIKQDLDFRAVRLLSTYLLLAHRLSKKQAAGRKGSFE